MKPFIIQKGSIYAVPVLHYTMELASYVKLAFDFVQPDCVAVELPEPLTKICLQAATRLPDISVIQAEALNVMCEPCDGSFEGLRSGIEHGVDAYCIDLDVQNYPHFQDFAPDPYSIFHIGLQRYYELFEKSRSKSPLHPLDQKRELYMARRLKELSFQHEKILFIGGMYHVGRVLENVSNEKFPLFEHTQRDSCQLVTATDESTRMIMAEYGWISRAYEKWRERSPETLLDRQKLIYNLLKAAAKRYKETTGNAFLNYHLKNTMKFVRNYALLHHNLMPNLFKILTAAKGCVDHNYAYEVWYSATHYPYRINIDNLSEKDLSVEQVWGHSKFIHFRLKQKTEKGMEFQKRKIDRSHQRYSSPSSLSICSYPPEDMVIENFGEFLKKKGSLLLSEKATDSIPFTTSLEDGIDTRETIRHLYEKKLYVKVNKKPPGAAGSVVVIFNEDSDEEESASYEKFPWKTTWHGEHNQESDMAFYGTPPTQNIVGPGISRCEYGGFLMSYPPRRLYDIWNDPDYSDCRNKAEILLMAAIEYALKPIIVYVAEKAPRSKIKSLANRFGKKIVYIPLGGLSPTMLNKIRVFHVLDGHDKREIAGDYIF